MIFSYSELGINVVIKDYKPLVFVVENEQMFVKMITDIRQTIGNDIEAIEVSENEKNINLSKAATIVIDPWSVDCNSKQIKNKLYQILTDIALGQKEESFLQIRTDLIKFVEDISEHIPYNLGYNIQIEPASIFKSMDVNIDCEQGEFIDTFIEYIKLLQSVCNVKVLFLVNIKSYLTSEQIQLMYKEAKYINLQLILLEYTEKNRFEEEMSVIIDKDNCIISI